MSLAGIEGSIDYSENGRIRIEAGDLRDGQNSTRVAFAGTAWLGERCISSVLNNAGISERIATIQSELDRDWQGAARRISGDYSFTYVNHDRDTCIIYRSVTSLSPVYYRDSNLRLSWSLNIADMFPGGAPALGDIDENAIPVLALGAPFPPLQTCYRGVRKVPPGTALVVTPQGVTSLRVDTLRADADHGDLGLAEAADGLRHHINDSVVRAVNGHDRAAVALSGGIDSAVVAVEATKSVRSLDAFHATFPHIRSLDTEHQRAQDVADCLGLRMTEVDMSASIANGGDCLTSSSGHLYPTVTCLERFFDLMSSQLEDDGITLLIGGDLGDNLFSADTLRAYGGKIVRGVRGPIAILIDLVEMLGCSDTGVQQALGVKWPWRTTPKAQQAPVQSLLTSKAEEAFRNTYQPVASMQPGDMISAGFSIFADRYSAMLNRVWAPKGISVANPFGDRTLIEYCLGLAPWHRNRVYAGQQIGKTALRAAYLDRLPGNVLQGYSKNVYMSVHGSYVRQNRGFLTALLGEDSVLASTGVIDVLTTRDLIHSAAPAGLLAITTAAGTEIWLRDMSSFPLPDMKVST